jgi:hypothetical protein
MAGRKNGAKRPPCTLDWNGVPGGCNSYIPEGETMCRFHKQLADAAAASTEDDAPCPDDTDDNYTAPALELDIPEELLSLDAREALRKGFNHNIEAILAFYADAVNATKQAKQRCTCGKDVYVHVPDWTARAVILKQWGDHAIGRAPEAPKSKPENRHKPAGRLTPAELTALLSDQEAA